MSWCATVIAASRVAQRNNSSSFGTASFVNSSSNRGEIDNHWVWLLYMVPISAMVDVTLPP